jgi:hypothetical protein
VGKPGSTHKIDLPLDRTMFAKQPTAHPGVSCAQNFRAVPTADTPSIDRLGLPKRLLPSLETAPPEGA